MRQKLLLLCLTLMITFFACKKAANSHLENQVQNTFFDSALQFLKVHLSNEDYAKLDFKSNKILRYGNKDIGIKIFERGFSADRFLLLGNKSGIYDGNWVDLSGLTATQSKYYSGSITLQSLDRKTSTKLKVDSNKVIQLIKSGVNMASSVTLTSGTKSFQPKGQDRLSSISRNAVNTEILPDVIVVCYSCAPVFDYSSLYWLLGGNYFYGDLYIPGPSGGGSTGTSTGAGNGVHGNNVAAMPIFISPEKPVLDLRQEFKCFTSNSSSTYSISVSVNEPFPNSRDVFNPLSIYPVGHTFYTLKEHNSDGSTVVRNVGFYPRDFVKPGEPMDKSIFGDDSYTLFDVSLEFNVNGSEFNTVLNTLINQQAYDYDLNNFNCTTSPIDALKSININLPDTKSAEILFTGNNPADLGEDIRGLNLNNFSADNGNRQFTRRVSNFNDQQPPAREGTCP